MFLRTVRTYFALVSGVLLNYRKVLKAGKKFDDPLAARKYVYDIASGIIEKTLDRSLPSRERRTYQKTGISFS